MIASSSSAPWQLGLAVAVLAGGAPIQVSDGFLEVRIGDGADLEDATAMLAAAKWYLPNDDPDRRWTLEVSRPAGRPLVRLRATRLPHLGVGRDDAGQAELLGLSLLSKSAEVFHDGVDVRVAFGDREVEVRWEARQQRITDDYGLAFRLGATEAEARAVKRIVDQHTRWRADHSVDVIVEHVAGRRVVGFRLDTSEQWVGPEEVAAINYSTLRALAPRIGAAEVWFQVSDNFRGSVEGVVR